MHGNERRAAVRQPQLAAALLRDAERLTEKRLRGGRTQRHDEIGVYVLDLGFQPRLARGNLAVVRLHVYPALALLDPLEVLHGIREVHVSFVDAGVEESATQESPRRPDKGPALQVLVITWLFAHEEQRGACIAFAKDSLGRACPQVAGTTVTRFRPELIEPLGDVRCRLRLHADSVEPRGDDFAHSATPRPGG